MNYIKYKKVLELVDRFFFETGFSLGNRFKVNKKNIIFH